MLKFLYIESPFRQNVKCMKRLFHPIYFYAIILTAMVTYNPVNAQDNKPRFPGLVNLEKLPAGDTIQTVEISLHSPDSPALDSVSFIAMFNHAKSVQPDDNLLRNWSYTPWAAVTFTTPQGHYQLNLFLGGLGMLTLPDKTKGAVLFELTSR